MSFGTPCNLTIVISVGVSSLCGQMDLTAKDIRFIELHVCNVAIQTFLNKSWVAVLPVVVSLTSAAVGLYVVVFNSPVFAWWLPVRSVRLFWKPLGKH